MVPIGDIEGLQLEEGCAHVPDISVAVDSPDGVGHAVPGSEIVLRRPLNEALHEEIHGAVPAIGKKNGARVGVDRIHMSDAFPLLVLSGVFMAFDPARFIFADTGSGHDTPLNVPSHTLAVHVIAGLVFPKQDPVMEKGLEISAGHGENLAGRRPIIRQIDLRFFDMEET